MAYLSTLSESERKLLLEYLDKYLPDLQLVSLVEQLQDDRTNTRKDMLRCAKAMGDNVVSLRPTPPVVAPAATEDTIDAPKVKTYIEPEGEAAARITQTSRDTILRILKSQPSNAAFISKQLKGTQANTDRLLKRLWMLKAVIYDGELYYLP